ncbi:MAG: glycosyltransferase family 4 protein [Kiritimatiellia bacterium]
MAAIHQFLAGFSKGDAISNEALVLRRIFRSWGYESEIVCELSRILPELRREAYDLEGFSRRIRPEDIVLLHLSIGSTVNDVFAALRCRKVILYHNITPPQYFELINKRTALDLERGRKQMQQLANAADLVLAVSEFNAKELTSQGYRSVKMFPLVLDFDRLREPPHRAILRACRDGRINVLCVGRIVPNKKLEDVLRVFFIFHTFVEPRSRLILAGSFAGTERYQQLLLAQTRAYGLDQTVTFTGSIPQSHLNALYATAHLLLSLSEHEGFCAPLLEAMLYKVPVMARAAGAIPETLDGAGVLLREWQPELIAEVAGKIIHDTGLRSAIIEGQNQRLERYLARNPEAELRELFASFLN